MYCRFLFLLILLNFQSILAQSGFHFETDKNKITIPFKLVNNLIFIPIQVNRTSLNLLLDTGVEETILLSLEDKNEVAFYNVEKIKLKGLGSDNAIEGLKSSNNILDLNGMIDRNHDLYIVLDQNFNFSPHVGLPVNGIIGYHFFKNNLVEINYDRKKIYVYKDNSKLRKKLSRRFSSIPISIEKNKPYIQASVTVESQAVTSKMLIDIGNSDAVWLFQNSNKNIQLPKRNFPDYLGQGFSGDVTGNRARISNLNIDDFQFNTIIAAFPDSLSVQSVNMVKDRIGSIGGEIFKRFTILFDYPENRIFIRKGNHFNAPFNIDLSGLEIQNESMQWIQETVPLSTIEIGNSYDQTGRKNNFKYKFTLKPIYSVSNVRKDSPADSVGILKGDLIIKINKKFCYKYSLQQITNILKSEERKWITLEIERNGQIIEYRFQLKAML